MTLPVTAALAAAMAALLLLLAFDTVRKRLRGEIAFGFGDDDGLTRAARAHGNLAEHAPIVIILVALLELSRADHLGLMVVAGVFLLSRVLHAIGMYMPAPPGKAPFPRAAGVMLTWACMIVLVGWTGWMLLGNL